MNLRSAVPTFLLALVAAMVGPGCFGERQWVVVFSTSARIPKMGDRLEIQILDDAGHPACDDCVRQIDATDALSGFPISMGIVRTSSAVRIRARLYRYTASSLAERARAIDVVARLPELGSAYGAPDVLEVGFQLPLTCFGIAPDLASHTTCQLDAGLKTVVGPEPTLGSAERTLSLYGAGSSCKKPTPEGMGCVGAGAFLLGDERFESMAFDFPARPEVVEAIGEDAALVMDLDEVTVGVVRDLVRRGKVTVGEGARALRAKSIDEACMYLDEDDRTNDALPMNCIGRDLAYEVCDALGKRLPYEAEWEFAAGNGVEETVYPWGEVADGVGDVVLYDLDDVVCEHAIVARGRPGVDGESTRCKEGSAWGPVAHGSVADVTSAGIRNLGGNVSEWVNDAFAFYDEPCWSKPLRYACAEPSTRVKGTFAPHRGGSWGRTTQSTVAVGRFAREAGSPSPYVGFRCALTEDEL